MESEKNSEEGLVVLRSAFEPLRCVAELYDYSSKARFRVFSESDEALLRMENIELHVLSDRRLLRETIEAARSNLTKRGVALRSWFMPTLGENQSGQAT